MHGDALAATHLGRAAGEIDFNGLGDVTTAEARTRCASDQEDFVDVVMQHPSEALEIVVAERQADLLRDAVADRVRMAEPFPLDHFHLLRPGRGRVTRSDDEIHSAQAAFTVRDVCRAASHRRQNTL